MTIPKVSITCDRFADKLADFLEREADEPTRAGIEAHAQTCAECGALLNDLRALRLSAANLPELAPSRDLWKGIAERIETPVVELKNGRSVASSNGGVLLRRRVWAGLAAAGLVAITATVTHELTKRSIVAGSPVKVAATTAAPANVAPTAAAPTTAATTTPAAATPDSAPSVRRSSASPAASLVSNRPSAEQTYDNEIARLRIVVNQRRSQLDSTTVAVIEHNLKVIDDAIRQCRLALRKDPGSRFLMESLNDALDTKVQLLRTAATLPSKA
jgi:Putative zinc-finger